MSKNENVPSPTDGQKPSRAESSPAPEKFKHKNIDKMAEEMWRDGYIFELKEVDNDFVLSLGDRDFHFLKTNPFPVVDERGKPLEPPASIEEAIRATIIIPDGKMYDTILALRRGKKAANAR